MKKSLGQISKEKNIPIKTLQQAVKDGRLPKLKDGRDLWLEENEPAFLQFLEKYRPRVAKK